MAKVIVQTDDGREVWSHEGVESWHVSGKLKAAGNVVAQAVASGIVRAVSDAEAIQEGRDPRRPSEVAIELAGYLREGKLYTYRHGRVNVVVVDESEYGYAFREVYPHNDPQVRTMTKTKFDRTFAKVEEQQPVASGG